MDFYTRNNTILTLVVLVFLWGTVVYVLPEQTGMHNLLAGFIGLAGGALMSPPRETK